MSMMWKKKNKSIEPRIGIPASTGFFFQAVPIRVKI